MNKNLEWGYEHPEVVGPNALMFFSWDLAKVIEQSFLAVPPEQMSTYLPVAQQAVNDLLRKYVELKADPAAFEGQSITIDIESPVYDPDRLLLALKTSPELEQRLIDLQERGPVGRT